MRATRHFKKLGEEVRQQVPLWCAPLLHPSWYITNDSGIPERCAQTSHMFPFGIAPVFTFHPIFHLQHTSAPSCTHAVWLCTFHLLPPTGVLYLIMCHSPSAVWILHFFTQECEMKRYWQQRQEKLSMWVEGRWLLCCFNERHLILWGRLHCCLKLPMLHQLTSCVVTTINFHSEIHSYV